MAEDEQRHDLSFIGEKQLQIRRVWNTEREEWFYSITDVVAVLLPDSPRSEWLLAHVEKKIERRRRV